MFYFNSRTYVNREFKIKDILKLVNANKVIRNEAKVIDSITLSNVISKESLNIQNNDNCKEIYIFRIILNEKDIPIEFIKELDKFTQLHTYFVLEYEGEFKELCIYRYIENGEIKRGKVYESRWTKEKFLEMPYCINIIEVYEKMVMSLIDLIPRENERVDKFLERYTDIQKLKKEINTLESKAFKEAQPRKKFDLGRIIRSKKEELRELER